MSIIFRLCTSTAKKIYPTLERWIPLEPLAERKDGWGPFSINKMCAKLWRIESDSEYLSYKHSIFAFKFMMALYAIVVADAVFGTFLVVEPNGLNEYPMALSTPLRNIAIFPWILITTIFYIRIRLSVDMRTERVPFLAHPAILEEQNKARFFMPVAIALYMISAIPLGGHYFPLAVARYFNQYFDAYHSAPLTLASTAFFALCLAGTSWLFVAAALTLEKSHSHFDDLKDHLSKMIAERDAITDKYRKNKQNRR
ncbi:MAG: hypothetical protein KGZ61_03785 [Sandarakinorhabdus sp.]|nr:hypothetical protein [Sandarakinorhabdus sp.]